jgi:hypothetical protein
MTALQYLGEVIEDKEHRFGFFNRFRYLSYCFTCPLMVYELVHTLGAPYAKTMLILTLFTLITALVADTSESELARWSWFGIGSWLNLGVWALLGKTVIHAHRLNDGLCSAQKTNNSEILKSSGMNGQDFPTGLIRLRTPMDEKKWGIDGAFFLIFVGK